MEVLVDANIFLAVILNEPEKKTIIDISKDFDLLSPEVVPYEIGNALSAMVKRNRINQEQAIKAFSFYENIPVRYVRIDISRALEIAASNAIYAYDAYFLEAAKRYNLELMTLDRKMILVAADLGVRIREVVI